VVDNADNVIFKPHLADLLLHQFLVSGSSGSCAPRHKLVHIPRNDLHEKVDDVANIRVLCYSPRHRVGLHSINEVFEVVNDAATWRAYQPSGLAPDPARHVVLDSIHGGE
jgi:hypothetical protein